MDEKIQFSVILPTYNCAHFLAETLDSILAQKEAFVEIIVIDGGSSDHTLEVIEQYRDSIAKLFFVTQKRYTLMCNKGAKVACGDYITFLWPAYSYLSSQCFYYLSRLAQEKNFPDFLYGATYVTESWDEDPVLSIFSFTKKRLKRGFLPTSIYSCCFKRETFLKMGGLRPDYSFRKAFFDLLCRLNKGREYKAAFTRQALTAYSLQQEASSLALRDFIERWNLIFKHFGLIAGCLWPFRKKPFHFLSWLMKKIKRSFLGRSLVQ